MKQLLEIVHSLGVKVEQLKGDADRVARVELAQVAHVHLGGEAGMAPVLHIVGAAANELERLVDRTVEQDVVVGHVEVAVVVDPCGLDPHHRRDKGREEYWLQIDTVEHHTNSHATNDTSGRCATGVGYISNTGPPTARTPS